MAIGMLYPCSQLRPELTPFPHIHDLNLVPFPRPSWGMDASSTYAMLHPLFKGSIWLHFLPSPAQWKHVLQGALRQWCCRWSYSHPLNFPSPSQASKLSCQLTTPISWTNMAQIALGLCMPYFHPISSLIVYTTLDDPTCHMARAVQPRHQTASAHSSSQAATCPSRFFKQWVQGDASFAFEPYWKRKKGGQKQKSKTAASEKLQRIRLFRFDLFGQPSIQLLGDDSDKVPLHRGEPAIFPLGTWVSIYWLEVLMVSHIVPICLLCTFEI